MNRRSFLGKIAGCFAALFVPIPLIFRSKGSEIIHVCVGVVDKPNKNGRIYPRVVMEKAIERANGRKLVVTDGFNYDVNGMNLSEVIGTSTLSIGNFGLIVAKIEPFSNDRLVHQADYRTFGIGNIDDSGIVTNFELTGIAMLPSGEGA